MLPNWLAKDSPYSNKSLQPRGHLCVVILCGCSSFIAIQHLNSTPQMSTSLSPARKSHRSTIKSLELTIWPPRIPSVEIQSMLSCFTKTERCSSCRDHERMHQNSQRTIQQLVRYFSPTVEWLQERPSLESGATNSNLQFISWNRLQEDVSPSSIRRPGAMSDEMNHLDLKLVLITIPRLQKRHPVLIEAFGCTLMKTHVFQWDTCNQMNSMIIPPQNNQGKIRPCV